MTKEALKLALEAMGLAKHSHGVLLLSDPPQEAWKTYQVDAALSKAITAIKEALAQPEQDNTYTYASSLATTIWQKHYMKDSPKWKPLDTTDGVLTQIDNMTCGLVKEKPAHPEPEYLAFMDTPQRTWVGLTDEEMQSIAFESADALSAVFVAVAKLKEKNNE